MKIIIFFVILFTFLCCKKSGTGPDNDKSKPASVYGEWQGSWKSSERDLEGEFDVLVIQDSTSLSGTIDLDELGLFEAEISGTIQGNNITFGDIENIITFSGKVYGDSIASGSYNAYQGQDKGEWNAKRISKIQYTQLEVISSFTLPDSVATDVTFDGEYFWMADNYSKKLYKITREGVVIGSITGPGDNTESFMGGNGGIVFHQGKLWIMYDKPFHMKMFALEQDGSSIIDMGRTSISGLTFDGEYIWGLDDKNATFIKMDVNGEVVTSFLSPVEYFSYHPQGGLAFDGTYLWFCSHYPARFYKLSTTGDLLNSYDFSYEFWHSPGLTYDGEYLWMCVDTPNELIKLDLSANIINRYTLPDFVDLLGDIAYANNHIYIIESIGGSSSSIYQFDTNGNFISSLSAPSYWPVGLTYDGSNLWISDDEKNKIYKLNVTQSNYFTIDIDNQNYLTSDGEYFWMPTYEVYTNLCKFDSDNNIYHYNFTDNIPAGMTYDGENLWMYIEESSYEELGKMVQFDLNGNELISYNFPDDLPRVYGLVYDGSKLWYVGDSEGSGFSPYQGTPTDLTLYQLNIP